MPVLGLDSKTERKPRSIPIADVKLVSSILVREHNEHNTKDIYAKIFKAGLFTSNEAEYDKLKFGGGKDARQAQRKGAGVANRALPKFFVSSDDDTDPTLTLLGNALILTPEAQEDQATVITNEGIFDGIGSGNDLGNGNGDEVPTTEATNSWTPLKVNDVDNVDGWAEVGPCNDKGRKIQRVSEDKLWDAIGSDFALRTNQPFAMRYTLHDPFGTEAMKAAFKTQWETADEKSNRPVNTFVQFYPKRRRTQSAFELYMGNRSDTGEGHFVVLVFYQNGTIAAFLNDTQFDKKTEELADTWVPLGMISLPKGSAKTGSKSREVDVSIYPIGNILYIYHSINPSTKDTKENKFSTFVFPEAIQLRGGSLFIMSYQGKLEFSFYPLIHKQAGKLKSPVIQTNFEPESELLNVAYLGKIGVGVRESPIGFPDKNDGKDDGKPQYEYLKDTEIQYTISSEDADEGSNAVSYELELKHSGETENERVHSPAILQTQYQALPPLTEVGLNPNPQIENEDVMAIQITDTVEGSQCSITLNNRKPADEARGSLPSFGNYTFRRGVNNFTGVKPIRVSVGYDKEDLGLIRRFTGFIVDRQYGRSSPTSSIVTLTCEDRSKQLKENYAVNLPIYDGWCHLAVIYDLAKEAGFADDEILLFEDPLTGDKKRIVDILEGDPATRSEGCFDGHIDGFPGQKIDGQPGSFIHQTLPLVPLHESPNYMFQMGTPLWDCMMAVRQHSYWYLFCNSNGNLIYSPPRSQVKSRGKVFREVDRVQAFDEFQRNLNAQHDTREQRNAVFLWGLIPAEDGNGNPTWTPDIHVRRQADWPNNVGVPSYYPWLRWAMMRNPKWNDHERNRAIASEVFSRVTRERIISTFGAWGQPDVFPYEIIILNEGQAGETGVDAKQFIISSITHSLNANGFTYDCDIVGELFDPTKFTFDPYTK